MALKKSNEAKITFWTDTLRADMTGSIQAIVIDTFPSIMETKTRSAADNREIALKIMQRKHEELKAEGR